MKFNLPDNMYILSGEATTFENSGRGNNNLTTSSPTARAASVQPARVESVYLSTSANFETEFYIDEGKFEIVVVGKPNPGAVISAGGNVLSYDGEFYTVSNEGQTLAHFFDRDKRSYRICMSVADFTCSVYFDDQSISIPAATISDTSPITVSLFNAGGIISSASASKDISGVNDIIERGRGYREFNMSPYRSLTITSPTNVSRYDVPFSYNSPAGSFGSSTVSFSPATEFLTLSFDKNIGTEVYIDESIVLNGVVNSSVVVDEAFKNISFINMDQDVSIYNIEVIASEGPAQLATESGDISFSGPPVAHDLSPHLQPDGSLFFGTVTYTPDAVSRATGGWFSADYDGDVLPGVSIADGVLTGTNLYVNGLPYSGDQLHGWYYLLCVNQISSSFVVGVPAHSLTFSALALTEGEVFSMYEQFFGNPTITLPEIVLTVESDPITVVQKEWSINTSG